MTDIPSITLQHAIAASLGSAIVGYSELADRIMAHGFQYRGYVTNAIGMALRCGMIQRVGGGLARNYRLNLDWKIDPTALAAAQAQRARGTATETRPKPGSSQPPSMDYVGPAFGEGPLAPSVGTVCLSQEELEGELPPYIGGRIVDSLHDRFDEIFRGIE
ncbi:MAG: hypothetical protein ACREPD_12985 [Stenotrophomonas sp.]|uniref:hypothetical protein n=1 Tax=Stenotrophomonas sp. TaxID=69392 RepID=UPI003D6CF220